MSKERKAARKHVAILSQWPGKYRRWQRAYNEWKDGGEIGEEPQRPVSPYRTTQHVVLPPAKEEWEL